MVSRIRQEAFHRSQVMDTFSYLTERIGPRLSNSPAMGRANAWTRGKFNEWKLDNVHDEAFDDFGRGWEFTSASVEMLGDRVQPLHALPKAWTPVRRARSKASWCRSRSRSPKTSRSTAASCAARSSCWARHANTSGAPSPIRTATTRPRWRACRSSPCPGQGRYRRARQAGQGVPGAPAAGGQGQCVLRRRGRAGLDQHQQLGQRHHPRCRRRFAQGR